VLLAGLAVNVLLRSLGWPVPGRAAGLAVVVAAAAGIVFLVKVWGLRTYFRAPGAGALSSQAAQVAGGQGANTDFLTWARGRMLGTRAAPTFWLLPDSARADAFTYQWSTYQLLPGRQTDRVQDANWIVLYGVSPAAAAYDHAAFGRLMVFTPGFAVAERTGVG
jgi:hypothetical protein